MKTWKKLWAFAIISTWIPLLLVIWFPSTIWYVFLTLWVATVFWIVITIIHRQSEREQRLLIQSVEKTAIKSLNHHRHDWMNDLQILYGYIQLGKHDKSIECVGRIKERMELEGKIAKLGIPSLVFYLQSFRTIGSNVELEINIADDLHLSNRMKEDDTENWVSAIVKSIRAFQYVGRVSWGESRKLTLSLYEEDGEIVAFFEGDGLQGTPEVLEQQIHNVVRSNRVRLEKLDTTTSSFQLRVPCDT
ncbi:Spo0B domain-containing protein [Paenibacillus sp. FA6]|uniref:Spo0B domain-containing protein n=1 Tax=Paenibacillus sp. FA6 TaxID=3413029 RepID=UPI003F65D92E